LAKVVQGVSQKDDVLLDWRHKDDGAIGTKRGVNSWRSPTKSMYVSLIGGFLEDVMYGINGNKKKMKRRERATLPVPVMGSPATLKHDWAGRYLNSPNSQHVSLRAQLII
jgi:hypothetical protein